jgi:hypothetical protein
VCKSCAEGGDRCADRRRLEKLTLPDLMPDPMEGRPGVDWGNELDPQSLWEKYPVSVATEAVATIQRTKVVEVQTTTDFLEALPEGSRPFGLEYRMKSPSSLARKLHTKALATGQGVREISGKLTDVLRYTAIVDDHAHLVGSVQSTVAGMESKGFRVVSAESSYVPGNPYKGIHLLVQRGDERPVEVQFHSNTSQAVKDQNHVDYERERDPETPRAERAKLRADMVKRSATLVDPPGLAALDTIGGYPVDHKTYPNPYTRGENEKTGGVQA